MAASNLRPQDQAPEDEHRLDGRIPEPHEEELGVSTCERDAGGRLSKDPAFMFYSSDFLTGTIFMTNEEVGIYVRLLCIQHQHGGSIGKVEFENMVGDRDRIREKFKENGVGYYNERLREETERRKAYSESRRKNRSGQSYEQHMINTSSSYVRHMEDEDEDEDKSLTKNIESETGKNDIDGALLGYWGRDGHIGYLSKQEIVDLCKVHTRESVIQAIKDSAGAKNKIQYMKAILKKRSAPVPQPKNKEQKPVMIVCSDCGEPVMSNELCKCHQQ